MADLRVRVAGVEFANPLILSSGPLSYCADAILRSWDAGASGAVTKTITLHPAVNPTPHLVRADFHGSLLNSEKWSDLPAERWIQKEIPALRQAGGGIIVASVGHTTADAEALAGPLVEAGAHMLEVVSYCSTDMAPSIRAARAGSGVPVFAKVSANWVDLMETVESCIEAGADGITAIDSVGPALAIDIETRRPRLEGSKGHGWLSGAAIKPVAVCAVAEIAMRWGIPVLGVGGISTGEDVVEMMMGGAIAVQAHTAPLLGGLAWFQKTLKRLETWLDEHGIAAASEISRAALGMLTAKEDTRPLVFAFEAALCNSCGRCVVVCAYQARALNGEEMNLDRTLCRSCGLCVSVCPTKALAVSGKD